MRLLTALAFTGLAISISALAVVTAITIVASRYPYDCEVLQSLDACPSPQTGISLFVRQRLSYFQAVHAFALKAVLVCCLSISGIPLAADVWRVIDPAASTQSRTLGLSLSRLDTFVQLSRSPGLFIAFRNVQAGNSYLSSTLFLVVLLAGFQLLTDFAVGPIYRTHQGPWTALSNFTTGGYMGPDPQAQFTAGGALVSWGVAQGRALLLSSALRQDNWTGTGLLRTGLPFMADTDIERIWRLDVPLVPTVYASLDCGPQAAPTSASDRVSINSSFWGDRDALVSIGDATSEDESIGWLTTEARLAWLAYSNASALLSSPGSVNATAVNIVIAVNATIEGAQQTIRSPTASSRISWVDVLYCRSSVMIQLSECTIERQVTGSFNGTNVSCRPLADSALPTRGLNDSFNDDDGALHIAKALAAAPTEALWLVGPYLPRFNIAWISRPSVFPMPFTTIGQDGTDLDGVYNASRPFDHMPLSYVKDTLIPQAQHGLVQGLLWPAPGGNVTLRGDLVASFATSKPWLTALYLGIGILLAVALLASVVSSRLKRDSRQLDLIEAIAIAHPSLQKRINDWTMPDRAGHVEVVYEVDQDTGKKSLRPAAAEWGNDKSRSFGL